MPEFRGRCHCGALEVTLATSKPAADLPLRACRCSFCRKHATRTTADPQGLAVFTVRDPAALRRYEFGHRTAAYIVCAACGVYLGAVIADGDRERALVNVNCFDDTAPFAREPTPVDYADEGAEARRARRLATWTPVRWEMPPAA